MTIREPSPEVLGRRVVPGEATRGEFTYSVVEVGPVGRGGIERRGDKRLRTRLRDGHIGARKHRIIADCRIKDRSEGGARLQLDKDRLLPNSFFLTDSAARSLYRADLIWQVGREAGVRLTLLE